MRGDRFRPAPIEQRSLVVGLDAGAFPILKVALFAGAGLVALKLLAAGATHRGSP